MEALRVRKKAPDDRVVALTGNPNVGKSTLFNALTGGRQHTGNWPGKTVEVAQGRYDYKGHGYVLVDLPGTYSLRSQSEEERVAEAFLQEAQRDCTVVVCDATCLERTLVLALQVLNRCDPVVVCVNLLDEASRHDISVDLRMLQSLLGVPVVGVCASSGEGLNQLRETIRNVADGFISVRPKRTSDPGKTARAISRQIVTGARPRTLSTLDRIALGKWSGRVVLLLLLLGIFWFTLHGANGLSALLERGFDLLLQTLDHWCSAWPVWLRSLLLEGVLRTAADVAAVMLPPMAVFFPLFTLLEEIGYLPRAAFLLDKGFQRCGSCGKQALTLAMGFGCNAVGVTGCRIISSRKERLLAIVTNALVPCNGRFPAMILLIAVFFAGNNWTAALLLTGFVCLSVGTTMGATALLDRMIPWQTPSSFVLEIPPYRRPHVGKVLLRSFLDRTLCVLGRALSVAAPAGAIIWCLQKWSPGGTPVLEILTHWLDPVGCALGMNGAILLAFLLSFPANELLLPMFLLVTQGTSYAADLAVGLTAGGMHMGTALCTLIFLLFHWPCATTCLTIWRETRSVPWTAMAIFLPTAIGAVLCSLLRLILPLW